LSRPNNSLVARGQKSLRSKCQSNPHWLRTAFEENPRLNVIYAGGYSAEVAVKDFSLVEGVNFLTKPFQAQKLAQTVRQKLDASTLS